MSLAPSASCRCSNTNGIEETSLKALLPEEYEYALCSFEKQSEKDFNCRFRINVDTKEGIQQWLKEFTVSSNTAYRISKTFPEDTVNNVYKVYMHCHHNTKPGSHNVKNPSAKHTNCPAQLTLTVKQKKFSRKYKSTDFHLPEMPAIVVLKHQHNHRIEAADALKFRCPNRNIQNNSKTVSKVIHSNETSGVESFIMQKENYSGNLNDDDQETSINESNIIEKFKNVFQEIASKAIGNPDVLNGMQRFIKNYENIRTEASLISSLSMFGKFTGFLEKKRLASYKKIAFQPTALARRKTAGGGRLCIQTGRPPKRSHTDEQSYQIKKAKSTIAPTKHTKAPNRLTHCVEKNINLGKRTITPTLAGAGGKVPISKRILPKTPQLNVSANQRNSTTNMLTTRPTVLILASPAAQQPVVSPATSPTPIKTKMPLIKSPNSQLQVQGLIPGQQLIRLAEGRLQLLTIPTVQQATPEQPAAVATPQTSIATTQPSILVTATAVDNVAGVGTTAALTLTST